MLKEIFATLLLTASIGTPSLQNNGNVWTTQNLLMGTYNYQSEFSLAALYDDLGDTQATITFDENTTNGYMMCAWYNQEYNSEESWLLSLDLSLEDDGGYVIFVTFNLLDIYGNTFSYTEGCYDGDSCQDLNYPIMMFDSFRSVLMSDTTSKLFNAVFTHEDNVYFVSYNGYYNFLHYPQINIIFMRKYCIK